MAASTKTQRTCLNGHIYYKSSDCPTCPICEQEREPAAYFLSRLSAPARRALEANGVTTLEKLAELSEQEVLRFHGMGPASLPKLREALRAQGLTFRS